ncbi:O-antigen ligase family protein [Cellulomonas bogoriensis]|uniref:Ligase n=1 Tax=Cellulomonas bogoriensis 69B4 = DSM 16987 TaxID=1386082 RepID=A0A0A0C180_9CELL|nr:hypothetical protein [Cellulomonas bogoriensis]KGM13945.1 ligase [Cellulomonas bogoriensis 69B4 = DSM 16987]
MRSVPIRPAALPRWPLAVGFVGYPLWWVTGIGDMVWPVVAAVMALLMVRCGGIRAPRGFGVWVLFLVWMAFSVIAIDSGGRLIGFTYRAVLYLSATVVFLYLYNARTHLTPRYVAGVLTCFWLVIVAGGYLGVLWPLLSFRTPLAVVLPDALLANELVREMAIRRVTQFDPGAWSALEPRPSAPFLYTNGWGNAYSILTPVVVAYLGHLRGTRRFWWLLLALPVSLVPALLTLNRGMFIGLAVAALYITARAVLAGRLRTVAVVAALGVVLVGVGAALPVQERLGERLETSSTTEDRADLYAETFNRTLESPVFGHGAPRPSSNPWIPSVGTQGQVWMVMFSHGLPAVVLFVGWFVVAFVRSWRRATSLDHAIGAVLLVTLVEIFYYGIVGTGLVIAMAAAAVAMRPSARTDQDQTPPHGSEPAAELGEQEARLAG